MIKPEQPRAVPIRAALGLPEGPPLLWLLFVAPAVQVVAHVDKILELSDWLQQALLRWREITRAIWSDLFGWLNITLPFDEYELDGLTLAVLCGGAAIAALIRGTRASLHDDVMRAYAVPAPSRLLVFVVISVVALFYFMAFFGVNAMLGYGGVQTGIADFSTLLWGACALAALLLVAFLWVSEPVLSKVRIEVLLGIVMLAVGVAIVLGISALTSFEVTSAYLHVRGLNWLLYVLFIAAIAAAIAAVLAVNWRALPAILLLAVTVIVADRIAQVFTPLMQYLESL